MRDLRPAGMMIEMSRGERHINIAGFANRLAIIQRLQNRKQPCIALDQPGQGIELSRPLVIRKTGPTGLCGPRGFDRRIDIGFIAQ